MHTNYKILFTKLNTLFNKKDAAIIANILFKNKLYDITEIQIRNSNNWYDVDKYEISVQKNNRILITIVDISKNIILQQLIYYNQYYNIYFN